MKKRIKSLSKLLIILCIAFLSSNCANDKISEKQEVGKTANIIDAKSWFEQYKSTNKMYSVFENQTYNWEKAKVEKLENGLEVITIPASKTYANKEYTGKRTLYLYPLEDNKNFKTTLYDVVTKRENSEDLSNFNGFIIAWNLETGFVNGLKFENNKSINSIVVEDFSIKDYNSHNSTGKAPPLEPIKLDEVFVGGCGGNSSTSTSITVRDFSIGSSVNNGGGMSTGGYTGGAQGGSGSSGASSINSTSQLVASINSIDANAHDITYVQNGNSITSTAILGLLPWVNLQLVVIQAKTGDRYIINNVVTNPIGLTLGYAWSQSAYSQTTNGNTTTITVSGIASYTLFVQSIGTIYSSPVTYQININNTNGQIVSGKRLP